MLRRKLLTSAEHCTYLYKSKYLADERDGKAVRENAANNWISGIRCLLFGRFWLSGMNIVKQNVILEIAAVNGHIRLMEIAKNELGAYNISQAFRAACHNGKTRAMAMIRSWLSGSLSTFYNDGLAEAVRGDQPAAAVLLERWDVDMTISLRTLNRNFSGYVLRASITPIRINKLLIRRGLDPIGLEHAEMLAIPLYGNLFQDMVLRVNLTQEQIAELSIPKVSAAPVA